MIGSAWRNFKFFESVGLNNPPLIPPTIEIVSCCLGQAHLFVGDCGGQIHIIDRPSASGPSAATGASTVVTSFQAYTGPVTHIKYLPGRNLLATLGDDDSLNTTILRLWHVDQCISLCQGTPAGGVLWRPPSREHRLFTAKYPAPTAATGSVFVKVNQNEERLCTLQLRAGGSRPTGNTPPPAGGARSADGDGIPATSLKTIVTAFDVSEDVRHCAVALTNGECVVLSGDLERERAVRTRRIRSGIAQSRMLFVGFAPAAHVRIAAKLTGEAAGKQQPAQPQGLQVLYTVYESMATVWGVTAAGEYTEFPCCEGDRLAAAGPGCACLAPDGRLIVCTGGDGALAILGPREPPQSTGGKPSNDATQKCFDPTAAAAHTAFSSAPSELAPPSVTVLSIADDGSGSSKKIHLLWHSGYAVLLTESPTRAKSFRLQCYDIANRIRALRRGQETFTDVAFLLSASAGGELLVLVQAPGERTSLAYVATALKEIDTLSKLDLLFSKECYGIAKSIADRQSQGVDPTLHRLIEKRYADYLYSKGKYADAMAEYTACIGGLEPSYVIRRYMQSQQIELLTGYLESLHQRRHGYAAHVSHTTLLLNCYIRQRDEGKLLAFVQRDDIRFDAPNAIAVCRQGGYYEAALRIADKYAQSYEQASILIHDMRDPKKALGFVRTLGVDDAEEILRKAGKQLIAWEPLHTTDAILQLCISWPGPARRLPADLQAQRSFAKPARRAPATEFMHVFVDSPVCLLNFLRGIVSSGVLEADFDAAEYGGALGGGSSVVKRPTHREEISADEAGSRKAVYNTLFELFITEELPQSIRLVDEPDLPTDTSGQTAESPSGPNGEVFRVESLQWRLEQAMTFLEAYAGRYDNYVVLTLSHQHRFEDGIVFLLRQMGLTGGLINFYGNKLAGAATPAARKDAKQKLLQEIDLVDGQQAAAGEAGRAARQDAWMTLLALLAQCPPTEWEDVARVLARIEEHCLLSPTVVMEIICGPRSKLQLSAVRDYCQRTMARQAVGTRLSQERTAGHLQRIEDLKQSIAALQTEATVFTCEQCAQCGQPLDFPAVHLLCRHSFHQRCLNVTTQCNLCSTGHRQVLESAKEQQDQVRSASGADEFFRRLALPEGEGPDSANGGGGFAVLAEYISKGALGPASSTSGALGQPSRRPEASLFAADPAIRMEMGGDTGKEVYDANGDVLDAEAVEWW